MASGGAEGDLSSVITFDNSGTVLDTISNLTETLTQEEQGDIYGIGIVWHSKWAGVCLFKRIGRFFDAEKSPRHKQITLNERDRLPNKNSAESTGYQTKWATTIKDQYMQFPHQILVQTIIIQRNIFKCIMDYHCWQFQVKYQNYSKLHKCFT